MKKLISLSALLLAVLVSVNSYAQTSDNATVAASATIVGALTVANATDLSFGDILTSETPTIAATDAGAGSVTVAGSTTGQPLNVTIVYPDSLAGTGADIGFDPVDAATAAAVNNANDSDPSNGVGLTSASLVTNTLTGTFTSTGATAYIFVGGQIDDATPGTAGVTYSSNITITVDYN